jgi:hypothetical protein
MSGQDSRPATRAGSRCCAVDRDTWGVGRRMGGTTGGLVWARTQNQGFSDRCCGWSWIAPITCGFRGCNARCLWSLLAVWMCLVTKKCPNDHDDYIDLEVLRWMPKYSPALRPDVVGVSRVYADQP